MAKRSPCCRSAPTAGGTGPDADSAADLHTGLGAVELDEIRAIRRAGIAASGPIQGKQPACCGFVRFMIAGRLSQRDRGRQHRNDDRKEGVSHPPVLSLTTCLGYRTN